MGGFSSKYSGKQIDDAVLEIAERGTADESYRGDIVSKQCWIRCLMSDNVDITNQCILTVSTTWNYAPPASITLLVSSSRANRHAILLHQIADQPDNRFKKIRFVDNGVATPLFVDLLYECIHDASESQPAGSAYTMIGSRSRFIKICPRSHTLINPEVDPSSNVTEFDI